MGTTDDATDDKYYAPASIVLPSTLTKIGNRTFMVDGTVTYESQLTEIKFPEGLVEIGQMAFQGSKLTSVSLPDSVTTIGIGAFSGSNALTSIKLSASLIEIPNNAILARNKHSSQRQIEPKNNKKEDADTITES